MASIDRREFLKGGALAAAGVAASEVLTTSRVAFAAGRRVGGRGDSRLVVVILRGAMDGLAAVPPCGDPDYARLRGEIAIPPPGTAGGALPLDGIFALHPAFAFLHARYAAGELAVVHAVASPYRARSHFDGQDVLENGTAQPHAVQTGWLNRALAALPAARSSGQTAGRLGREGDRRRELAVALGQNVPLVMRGPIEVASWAPSHLASLDEETLQRVQDLYSHDPLLSQRLADALAANAMAADAMSADRMAAEAMSANARGADAMGASETISAGRSGQAAAGTSRPAVSGNARRHTEIVRAAAGFLRPDDGPRIAVFDTNGWDTHANEGGAQGQLDQRFAALDAALEMLKDGLGPAWRDTAVVLVTEFGRTAAVNGTRGTDHGTATVAFLVGGAVRGGRVIADWPGLSGRALYQGRDLAPTLDLRSVLKGVLHDHLGVSAHALEASVFPESGDARPMRDLIRA